MKASPTRTHLRLPCVAQIGQALKRVEALLTELHEDELTLRVARDNLAHIDHHEDVRVRVTIDGEELALQTTVLRLLDHEVDPLLGRSLSIGLKLASTHPALKQRTRGDRMIAASPQMQKLTRQITRLGHSDVSVYIRGETGVGKALVARAVHDCSPRASHPFVTQHCANVTEAMMHNALLAHVHGPAHNQEGVFERANRGTLFLDDVADLSLPMQAVVLRALEEQEMHSPGASKPVKLNVRVICATHRNLQDEVAAKRFREDLYFRLAGAELHVPPLRQRREDIEAIANQFLGELQDKHRRNVRLSASALATLQAYAWPGNVRELKHELECAVLLSDDLEELDASRFSEKLTKREESYDDALARWQRQLVSQALVRTGGVVSHAANLLHMESSRLRKLIQRLGPLT